MSLVSFVWQFYQYKMESVCYSSLSNCYLQLFASSPVRGSVSTAFSYFKVSLTCMWTLLPPGSARSSARARAGWGRGRAWWGGGRATPPGSRGRHRRARPRTLPHRRYWIQAPQSSSALLNQKAIWTYCCKLYTKPILTMYHDMNIRALLYTYCWIHFFARDDIGRETYVQ